MFWKSITYISEFQADRSQWDLLSPYNGKTVMLIFLIIIMNLSSIENLFFQSYFCFALGIFDATHFILALFI